MGLDVYLKRGPHDDREDGCEAERVEIPSARYPDHYFKIGYWRSSYNEGGINSVLRSYGLGDLYTICDAGDEYALTPDWPDVIARTDALLDDFDKAHDRMRYRAFQVMHIHEGAQSAEDALARFFETIKHGGAFSNGYGYFDEKGVKVHAIITGRNSIGGACSWIVAENSGVEWYRHALEIVKETAGWVLAQPDPKAFHLHWSS